MASYATDGYLRKYEYFPGQVDGVVNQTGGQSTRRVGLVYYKSVDCNPLTPLLRCVLASWFLHSCTAVNRLTQRVVRVHRPALAELLACACVCSSAKQHTAMGTD